MVNMNGDPGLTPNAFAPLMRGLGDGLGVRITASSREGALFPWVTLNKHGTARKAKMIMIIIKLDEKFIRLSGLKRTTEARRPRSLKVASHLCNLRVSVALRSIFLFY
jgi:hypothetical protein